MYNEQTNKPKISKQAESRRLEEKEREERLLRQLKDLRNTGVISHKNRKIK
jgi:hypothetical protein